MVLGKLDIHMEKNEVLPFTYTMFKNQLKMDQTLKFKSQRAKPLNFHKKTPLLPKLTLWFMIFMYTFDFYGYHLPDAQVI